MSSTQETENHEDEELMDDLRDSGYSQAPSSNLSQTEGCPEILNSNSEYNSTTKMEVNANEEVIRPVAADISSSLNSCHQQNKTNSENEIAPKLHQAQNTKQEENYPKRKSDSNKEKRLTRRHSSPNKIKTSSDQKESMSRRRRERRKSQTADQDKKSGHRASFDLSMKNVPKNGKRTRYGSLPSKLEDLDNSFDRINKLNSRLNSKVDSCLSLVDSVLELNAATFDPDQEDNIKAKLKEISASLSDTTVSDENIVSDGDGSSKREALSSEIKFSISSSDDNEDKVCVPVKQQNNLELLTQESSQLEQSNLTNPNITHRVNIPANLNPDNSKNHVISDFVNKTEIQLHDAAEVECYCHLVNPGYVIVSGSESDERRPRLDTVAEETEGSEEILDNVDDTSNKLSQNLDRKDSQDEALQAKQIDKAFADEPEIVKSSITIPLQSALPLSTLTPNNLPVSRKNEETTDANITQVPSQSTPLPISKKISDEELISLPESPIDERTDSPPSSPINRDTNLSTPSRLLRKISVDELDSLPESTIDSQSASPAGSPVRKVNKNFNVARDARNALLKDPKRLSLEMEDDSAISLQIVESDNTDIKSPDEDQLKMQEHVQKESSSEPLRFTQSLKDTLVLDGDALRLEVCIAGNPLPKVTWYKGLREISSDRCEMSYDGDDRWSLVVRKVTREDEGEYLCKAANGCEMISTTCFLHVKGE